VITGANGGKSKPASAKDRLRNVHIAIMADNTDLVCDTNCYKQNLFDSIHILYASTSGITI